MVFQNNVTAVLDDSLRRFFCTCISILIFLAAIFVHVQTKGGNIPMHLKHYNHINTSAGDAGNGVYFSPQSCMRQTNGFRLRNNTKSRHI